MSLKFGFWSEGETQVGNSYTNRYHELMQECLLAEKMGFEFCGLSEQHVALGGISTSAPEVMYGYLAAITTRIRLRNTVALMPTMFNHPLRTAERIATNDILSNGRFECYTGRSNTTIAMRAFNVDPAETLPQFVEGMDLLREALSKDIFTFQGKYYQVPPRSLVPKPVQKPYPLIGVAATSARSHEYAGREGYAVLSSATMQGFEYQAELLDLYRKAYKPYPISPLSKPLTGVPMYCGIAATDKKAEEMFRPGFQYYAKLSTDAYPRLAKIADDYSYLEQQLPYIERAANDWDYLLNHSAGAVCGSPDTVIRQLEEFQKVGLDEVYLRIDSVSHELIMQTIDMVGRYVIPHFNDRNNVVRPTEDILNDIRAMRAVVAASPGGYPGAKKE